MFKTMEKAIADGFNRANAGVPGAIKLARCELEDIFMFVQFESSPGPVSPANRRYRVYVDVSEKNTKEIDPNLLSTGLGSDDDFVSHSCGIVVTTKFLQVDIHACPRGVFVLHDPRKKGSNIVYTYKVGEGRAPARGPFNVLEERLSKWQHDLEAYLRLCHELTSVRDRKCWLGTRTGGFIFADFSLGRDALFGMNIPFFHTAAGKARIYRFYFALHAEERSQIPTELLSTESLDDAVLNSEYDGRIYMGCEVSLYLHICPGGVTLLFFQRTQGKEMLEFFLGGSRPRQNSFRIAEHARAARIGNTGGPSR